MAKNIIIMVLACAFLPVGYAKVNSGIRSAQGGQIGIAEPQNAVPMRVLGSSTTPIPCAQTASEGNNGSGNVKGGQEAAGNMPLAEEKNTEDRNDNADTEHVEQSAGSAPDETENARSEESPAPAQTEESTTEKTEEAELNETQTVIDKKLADYFESCDRLFKTYVDENGDVDYALLRRKRLDIIGAHRRLSGISTAEYVSYSRQEKIAFWINTHNLLTLELIVENYPIQPRWYMITYPDNSIIQIPGGRDKVLFEIWSDQTEHTLSEIEHRLLGKFDDLRVCFALSYASKGSAFLRNEAFWPARLDEQLDQQVKRFVESDRGMMIVSDKNVVKLSDVFNRYRNEFANSDYAEIKRFRDRSDFVRACLNFILEYVSGSEADFLLGKDFEVKFINYDWHLNEQPEE